jgi:hypothetical protein
MAITTNNSISVKPSRRGKTIFVRRATVFMVENS